MSRTAEEILALYQTRKARLDPLHAAALEVRSAYYGDITLPLPEIDRNEKPLVANFLYSAGEQKSMRVASTMPDMYYPSVDPGAPRADGRARDRRAVNLAWWDLDVIKMKMRKRARHMVYYANSPVMIRPHLAEKRPTWQVRNPLSALAPEMDTGEVAPEDVIFTYPKPYAWLVKHYPDKARAFGETTDEDGTFTVLEYQDAADFVLLVVGTKTERSGPGYNPTTTKVDIIVELQRAPNRVGMCTAVFAGGIGLDHPRGAYDGMIGLWQAMGKIMALQAIGLQRSIWPETWLEGNGTEAPRIVTQADPLAGIVGETEGGKLQVIQPHLNQDGLNLQDRLERFIRIDSSTPAELGGESTSNIRTGRRGDQILSSVLDFPLQEMQEILAISMQAENKIAIAIDKAYFPTSKTIPFISSSAGEITYKPSELWETDVHFVKYAHAGVDAQGLVIEGAQRVGIGSLSIRSFMEMDPLVEDPQGEFDRIAQEKLRTALLNGMEQMSQDPQMAPVIAQVMVEVRSKEVEIEDAVLKVHQAIQAQQAAQAAPAPGMPEAQPGMAAPSIGAPPQGLSNLTALLGQLKRGPSAAVPNQLGIAS